jgi:chitosanase
MASMDATMLTATQKKTAEAIVNIFETSSVQGNYGSVTLLDGDTGHLTFGRSQTTLGSGNLYKLLQSYCANPGGRFGAELQAFLPRFEAKDFSLDNERHLKNLLRASADDSVMRETQDVFFDQAYWQPAQRMATQRGIVTPLGVAVVYDSTVHGSWKLIQDRTNEQSGALASVGEKDWITAYVSNRQQWLASHSRSDLRATVYRMDAFQRLIELGMWGLELPLVVRGEEISMSSLNATPRNCFDGPQPGSRALAVQSPLLRGLDVRLVQLALSRDGIDVTADGVFGQGSLAAIKTYQRAQSLPATGMADAGLIARLVA